MSRGHRPLTASYLHVVALPSLPPMVTQSIWWSLEAKQGPFSCCLPAQWESCPLVSSSALCARVGSFMLGEQGGRWNSALEMVPVRKSVSPEECPLRAVTSEGSVPQACREVGLKWPRGSRGLAKGFSQRWLNQAALPCGRQLHCPAPQLTWETFRTHSLLTSILVPLGREGWKRIPCCLC